MTRHPSGGTRFRLFPQFDEGFAPEIVAVSSPCGSLGPGPADARMYVANAVRKASAYDPPDHAPPYRGAQHPPAVPDGDGHFDAIAGGSPQFRAAHLFGTVRLVLDIWEAQAGEAVQWWHPDAPPRLELIPVVQWRNAQSGPGFLETGLWPGFDGAGAQPFCLNFDVVAHEVGHAILFGLLGVPPAGRLDAQFLAFHECFGDITALLGALHFASVRRRLLQQTAGDLYAPNLVNRLAETAPHQQLRMASNDVTMRDVAGVALDGNGEWVDAAGMGRNAHALSLPMTGAIFDLLVEVYQEGLLSRGLIRPLMDARGWSAGAVAGSLSGIHAEHMRAYARFAAGFDAALMDARDAVSGWLLHAVRSITAGEVRFDRIAARLLEAAALGGWAALFPHLLDRLLRRGIDPRPHLRLAAPHVAPGVRASRRERLLALMPAPPAHLGCCGELRRLNGVRSMMPHAHRAA